jgi:hypothetical protein
MLKRLVVLTSMSLLMLSGRGDFAFASDNLRYELEVLRESVDAGITQDEFHQLRIKIGALYRMALEDQRNEVSDLVQHVRAADAIWTGMKSDYSCHNNSTGFMVDATACVHNFDNYYHSLGLQPPQVEKVTFQAQIVGPVLKQIANDTDMALSKLK